MIFQSTRSQDRDLIALLLFLHLSYFNPLGRKTETPCFILLETGTTFQSTRSQDRDLRKISEKYCTMYFNPLGRKTETKIAAVNGILDYISIHSVARPRRNICLWFPICEHFNPLGRKTETCIVCVLLLA